MNNLDDLRASVLDKQAFGVLAHFEQIGAAFLRYANDTKLKEIVSPGHPQYFFFQYDALHNHKITRPLNRNLFLRDATALSAAFARFIDFLGSVRQHQREAIHRPEVSAYLETNEFHCVVYTVQQSIGCIADSFADANQARKRVGILFETLIKLMLQEVGLFCQPRTVRIPIPGQSGYEMRYELDVVFSRNRAVVAGTQEALISAKTRASKIEYIAPHEIVGSVKTTSKDRIDKIFLDKYLLTQFLGRNVPVVAIFLHDVQRATSDTKTKGQSIFGVASTFKTGHFLGYTVALNKLDGVYYIDPRPEMLTNPKLAEQIKDLSYFLLYDLWTLSE